MKRLILLVGGSLLLVVGAFAVASSTYAGRTFMQLKKFEDALLVYSVRTGTVPKNLDELSKLVSVQSGWFAPYYLVDAWNQPIKYKYPSESDNRAFDLYSSGPDLKDNNGKGDDVVPWEYRNYYSSTDTAKKGLMLIVLLDAPLLLVFMLLRWMFRRVEA